MSKRPENQLPPDQVLSFILLCYLTFYVFIHFEQYYNEKIAKSYTQQTRIITLQAQLTERALELLNIPPNESYLILDIGCGSGLSGEILSENNHNWIGVDISRDMLNVARDKQVEGDLIQMDMGQGLKFRPGSFDAAISISALQWLCVASKKNDNPFHRLKVFFQSLYNSLKQGGRAVLQFYPDGPDQLQMITNAAMKCGFSGGLIIDFPNSSKAKKIYLVIDAGYTGTPEIVMMDGLKDANDEGNEGENEEKKIEVHDNKAEKNKRFKRIRKNQKLNKKSKIWIVKKKERMKKLGKHVKTDSKYTGRKRSILRVLK